MHQVYCPKGCLFPPWYNNWIGQHPLEYLLSWHEPLLWYNSSQVCQMTDTPTISLNPHLDIY